jgi:transposase-like protein
MSTHKNRHWTEDDARQVLARGEREGKSITALAREQGVSPQRLYWWKKRLRGEEPSTSSFVEVSCDAVEASLDCAPGRTGCDVMGAVEQVPRGEP